MSNNATNRRVTPRLAPTLKTTPVGRRSFVLRLVHDRAIRAARPSTPPPKG